MPSARQGGVGLLHSIGEPEFLALLNLKNGTLLFFRLWTPR
jgi:hypothetical protein